MLPRPADERRDRRDRRPDRRRQEDRARARPARARSGDADAGLRSRPDRPARSSWPTQYQADDALFGCCVDLGRESVDTRSNAEEVARWVDKRKFRSVRLVTTDWHMPRARFEISRQLGGGIVGRSATRSRAIRASPSSSPNITNICSAARRCSSASDERSSARCSSRSSSIPAASSTCSSGSPSLPLGRGAGPRGSPTAGRASTAAAPASCSASGPGSRARCRAAPVLVASQASVDVRDDRDRSCILDTPAAVMKSELGRIPLWGRLTRAYGIIPVDRDGGAAALRRLLRGRRRGDRAKAGRSSSSPKARGSRPASGRRSSPASPASTARSNLPVVPVALDSGRVWPRRSFVKRPGMVTMRFGEPIPPGLPRKETEARVHAAINALEDPSPRHAGVEHRRLTPRFSSADTSDPVLRRGSRHHSHSTRCRADGTRRAASPRRPARPSA